MGIYLWVMLCLFGISVLAKLYFLATGKFEKRTANGESLDVIIHIIVITWTAVILFDA